jgi:hypothetical protein
VEKAVPEESAVGRRIVPLCRKKTLAHELAFAVLNSGINDPRTATAEFKCAKTGAVYAFTCDAPKHIGGITVVIAKRNTKKGIDENGCIGTISVTIDGIEETKDLGGLGEPTS